MKSSSPLITIGVPVYNGEPFLRRCLDSLMNQTYKNVEFLITNNGSTDKTPEIIKEYCQKDSRFRMIDAIKQSAGPARTEQCRQAKGEFIGFCDADDYLEPNFIEKLISVGTDYDCYIADWYKFYESGKKEIRHISLEPHVLDRDGTLKLQKRIVGNDKPKSPMDLDLYSSLCGKLYRVSIINDNNISILASGTLGGADDALFNLDFLQFANSVIKIDAPLYDYFSNPKSFSHTHKLEDINKLELQYLEFEKRLQKYEKDSSYYKALSYRIYIQTFSVFLIAMQSNASKKEQKKTVKECLQKERFQNAFKEVNGNGFSIIFRPFFKKIRKNRLGFCWNYIKLANVYRKLKN